MANYVSTLSGAEVEAALGFANNGSHTWLSYDMITPSVDGSLNIASTTDHGTGLFSFTLTSLMTNAFYAALVCGGITNAIARRVTTMSGDNKVKATDGWGVSAYVGNTSDLIDSDAMNLTINGPLA